jgi:hypothetical protein
VFVDPSTKVLHPAPRVTGVIVVRQSTTMDPIVAVRLTLGISRLGEADLMGWWSSQGMNPAVRFALAGFRRTGGLIGAELALLSAIRRHHQLLPRTNAVHLFSTHLPFATWARAHLAEQKEVGHSQIVEELQTWTTVEHAHTTLDAWRGLIEPGGGSTTHGDSASLGALLGAFVDGYVSAGPTLTVPHIDAPR